MKKVLHFLLLAVLFLPFAMRAQTPVDVIVGTGTDASYVAPFNNFYRYSWNECIYPAAEIDEMGYVNSISWYVSASSQVTCTPMKIYMGTTAATTHSSSSSWLSAAELTLVYDTNSIVIGNSTGWVTYTLQTPFYYDGNDNLVVVVAKYTPSYSSSLTYRYTNTTNACLYRNSDSDASYEVHPGTTSGTLSYNRANIRLNITPFIPSCPAVTQMAVSNITPTTVDLSWRTRATQSEWEYVIGTPGFDPDLEVPVSVSDSNITISGLTANTTYQIAVRAVCGPNDVSTWKKIETRTACDVIATLPYNENFNSWGTTSTSFPICWSKLTTYSTYPYVSSTNHSSPGSLYFYASVGNYNLAATEGIDDGVIGLSEVYVSFWYYAGSSNAKLRVGVMTDPTDINSFELVETISSTITGTWKKYEVYFDQYEGMGTHIALLNDNRTRTESNYFYVDDFVLDYLPSCARPNHLAITSVGSDEVTFAWDTHSGESSWEIAFDTLGFVLDSNYITTAITDNPYTITGLEPNTSYTFYVRASCGGGDISEWSAPISFMTLNGIPAEIPYTCDFEDADENAEWLISNGTATNKWYIGGASGVNHTEEGDSALYVSGDNGATNSYLTNATSNVWAYRDIHFSNDAEFDISFYWKNYGESCCDYIRVYLGDPMPVTPGTNMVTPTGAVQLNTTTLNVQSSWQYFVATVPGNTYANTTKRLYFMWRNDSSVGTMPPASVDDISIMGFSCGRPQDITMDSVTTTVAAFHWTPATEDDNAWEVVLVPYGSSFEDAVSVSVTDPYYVFEDLNSDTPYSFYVRTDCGGVYSGWSTAVTVRTECPEYASLPYNEAFDTYGTGSSIYFPNCWDRLYNSSTYPYISGSNSSSVPGSLYFFSSSSAYSLGMMPPIDTMETLLNTLSVSFKLLKTSTSYSGSVQVGVMSDRDDANSFTAVATTSTLTSTNTWVEYEIPLTDYTGFGNTIAVRVPSGITNYVYMDDFSVFVTPSCLRPMSVAVSGITAHGATVSWTTRNEETAWEIVVVPHGSSPESGTPESISSNPYTVELLTDNTNYDVYVRSDCGGGDISNWSSVVSFKTLCLANTILPYVENFDSYGTTSNVSFPSCWGRRTNYSSTFPYITSSYASSGVGSLYFYASATNYSYGFTQGLDLSDYAGIPLHATFKVLKSSESYGRLQVGIMSDPGDINTFVVLKNIYPNDLPSNYVWYEFDVPITGNFNSEVYLAFVAPQGGASYAYLDDVVVDVLSGCSAPSDLSVSNVAGTSALLSWTASQYAVNEYTVEYSEAGMDAWVSYTESGTSHLLTQLTENTSYDVMVYAACDDGSSDTLALTFTTGCLAGGNITVGTGTDGSNVLPTNGCYNYSISQQLYTSTEVGAAGNIRGISFDLVTTTGSDNRNLTVYMANTDMTTLSSTNYLTSDSMTQVYSGTVNFVLGWNQILFSTPFQHDGRNIVIMVDDNTGTYNCSPQFASTAGGLSLYEYDDVTNFNPSSPSFASSVSERNNIIFHADCDSVVTCVTPNVFVTDLTDESVTLSWANGLNENSWQIEYRATTETSWTQEGAVSSSPYTIGGLTAGVDYLFRMRSDCGSGSYSEWVSVSVHTPCAFINSLPYTENFDSSTGSGNNYFIDCWTRHTNSTSSYPYTSNSQSYSSPYSLYFYGTSSYYAYAATSRFDDDIQMDSLQITFQMRKTSDAYFIEVGIMSDPDDPASFVSLGNATPAAINTWEYGEINTDAYTGNGHYVAFRVPQWIYNYMYIDNVSVDYIPSCRRVNNLRVSNILANDVSVSWEPAGYETAWEYLVGLPNTIDYSTDVPTGVTTASFDLSNLNADTRYELSVRAVCDDGNSSWNTIYFRTACDIISVLPYRESFDTYGTGNTTTSYPSCWSRITNYSSNYPYINSTNFSSPGGLYFYANGSGIYNLGIAPPFSTSIPVNTLQVTFQYRTSYSSDKLIIGVMTSPTDATTFVPVDTVTNTTTGTWYQKRISMENYAGTGQYIALKNEYGGVSSAYAYVDDFEADILPSCDDPENFAISSLSSNSATFTWEDGIDETTWQIIVCLAGTAPDFTNPDIITSNPYTVNDLSENTAYDVYLRTVCYNGLGYSNWINMSFMTISSVPAAIPYFHDFEDGDENAAWVLINGSVPNKWYIGQPTGFADSALFISNDNGLNNTYTLSSASSTVWAYRDFQFGSGAEFNLSFNWRAYGESSWDYIQVYIGAPNAVQGTSEGGSTIGNPPAGALQLPATRLNLSSNWQRATYVLDGSYANTLKRIYFAWHNDASGGTNPPGAIDSVEITVSNCGRPRNIVVSNLTTTTADVSFTPAIATDNAWEYVVVPAGTAADLGTTVPINSTTFIANNLPSSSNLDLYIRTVCDDQSTTAWAGPASFATLCEALTANDLPYSENFDSYGIGSSTDPVLPICWNRFSTYASALYLPYVSSTAHSGTRALYFYVGTSGQYNMAIMPQIDASLPINTLQLTFQYYSSNSTDKLIVGVMSSVTDGSTFVPVDTVYNTSTGTWYEKTVSFADYTGTGSFIAFKNIYNSTSTAYARVDDIFLELIPSCVRPTAITAGSTDVNTEVEVSWTEAGTATAWNIIYGPTGFNPNTGGTTIPVTANPYTVTGLTTNTQYDFYVQSVCSATDQSVLRGPATATPGLIIVPANGNSSITTCNAVIYDAGGPTGNYGNNWNGYLIVNPATAGNMVSVSGHHVGEGCCDYVTIYDGAGTSGAQLFHAYSPSTGDTLHIPNITSTTGPLTIRFNSDVSNVGAGFALTVSCGGPVVVCEIPTNVAASAITNSSATISWTAGGNETSWSLDYKAASDVNYTSVQVNNTPSYNLAGLTANTQYSVRIKAICGTDDESEYTQVYTFTTLAVNTFAITATASEGGTITPSGTVQVTAGANQTFIITPNSEYAISDLLVDGNSQGALATYTFTNVQANHTIYAEFISTGIQNNTLENGITLYPNPADTKIELVVAANMVKVQEADIYDVYGKLIKTVVLTDNRAVIDVTDFAGGVYFVRIALSDNTITKKFIKK